MNLRIVGIAAESLIVTVQGLVETAQSVQCDAAIELHSRVSGRKFDRPIETRDRLLDSLQGLQNHATRIQKVGIFWRLRDRLAHQGQAPTGIARLCLDYRKHMRRDCMLRKLSKDLLTYL